MKKALAAILTLAATPALAHVGHGETSSFAAGVAHPLMRARPRRGAWSPSACGRR